MTSPDKVALVTGGSRGIGRQLALAMARHGATVVVTARNLDSSPGHSGDTLRGTVEAIEAEGGTALRHPRHDHRLRGREARLVEETVERAGRLDVLREQRWRLSRRRSSPEMSDEDWHDNMDVNMNAVFYVTRAALPVMARQGGGRIYNVSSDLAIRFAVGARRLLRGEGRARRVLAGARPRRCASRTSKSSPGRRATSRPT